MGGFSLLWSGGGKSVAEGFKLSQSGKHAAPSALYRSRVSTRAPEASIDASTEPPTQVAVQLSQMGSRTFKDDATQFAKCENRPPSLLVVWPGPATDCISSARRDRSPGIEATPPTTCTARATLRRRSTWVRGGGVHTGEGVRLK